MTELSQLPGTNIQLGRNTDSETVLVSSTPVARAPIPDRTAETVTVEPRERLSSGTHVPEVDDHPGWCRQAMNCCVIQRAQQQLSIAK